MEVGTGLRDLLVPHRADVAPQHTPLAHLGSSMSRPERGSAPGGVGALALALALAGCSAQTSESEPSDVGSAYVDGTYEARGWYGGLPSHQDVTLTIAGDIVTAVEITTPAENDTSLGYQQRFAEALPDAIVGRPIDELDVDRLAGSSGCSEGFMAALAEIKDLAK